MPGIFFILHIIQKNTHEEYGFEYIMMCDASGKRFDKIAPTEKIDEDDDENVRFKLGMENLISGIHAHVASNVIMANMASLLTMLDSRFVFSHEFNNIFITQINNYLDENDVQF